MISVIICAAGRGRRAGFAENKVLHELGGLPVLSWSLSAFSAAGADEIEFYGGGGGREDHFLGNLHLLYAALKKGVRAAMVTNYARIFAAEGEVVVTGRKGSTLSIVPFGGNVHIMENSGFYYPLPEAFVYGSTRGISNVVTADTARFTVEGTVLVFIDEGGEL